jgi:hypothetical protein
MPRLSKRLPYELLIVGALALGSCSEGGRYITRDQAIDIAGDTVGDAIPDDDTVRDLKTRVEAIEERLGM